MATLRTEQRRVARDRILDALATEIAENGLVALSIPAVAKRAGVSLRTVYNHFENKDVLIASLSPWAEQRMEARGGRIVETDPDAIPDAIRTNFRLFDELGDTSVALSRVATLEQQGKRDEATDRLQDSRTAAVRAFIETERPDLDPTQHIALTAIFRSILSFSMWDRLVGDFGLTGEEAGEMAAWAYEVMLRSLRQQQGPFDPKI